MRIVRRASLLFSLVLIVAVVVGYVARHGQLERQRDLELVATADVAASRFGSIVDAVRVTADAGAGPAAAAEALSGVYDGLVVCATDRSGSSSCAGAGSTLGAHVNGDADDHGDLIVEIYDGQARIDMHGDELIIVAQIRADAVSAPGEARAWVSLIRPEVDEAGFASADGVRETFAEVAHVSGVYIVTAAPDDVSVPDNEQRYYAIVFVLGVVLMALAGITLYVEQRSLRERAAFDPLTRLPNRSEFIRCVDDVVAGRDFTGASLLLMDLNDFKQVNDTYGHGAGDELLAIVANRLRRAVRRCDIVGRWGGDEFVVFFPGIVTAEMGERRAVQLSDAVSGRTRLDGASEPVRLKMSIGVAVWPHHGSDLDTLVDAADRAMYRAKRDGKAAAVAEASPPSGGDANSGASRSANI